MFTCFVGLIRLKKHGIRGATLLEDGDDVETMWGREERKKA